MAKMNLKNLLGRVELKSKFNFETFTGIALENAEAGDIVKMVMQFNVTDDKTKEMKSFIIQTMLDTLVYPEIMHRVHEGKLPPTYKPYLVHILLNTQHSKNKVLLGKETNFSANFTLKEERKIENNEKINFGEVKKITKIFPRENYMGDSAHIMLVKIKNQWMAAIDLVFDRLKIKIKMNQVQDFLNSAKDNLDDKRWAPFVNDIWRSTELMVQSLLLFRYHGGFSVKQDHATTMKIFKEFCDNGNVSLKFSKHFEELSKLSKPARYGTGIKSKFEIKEVDAKQYLETSLEMLDLVNNTLEIVDRNRKPSSEKIMKFW